jgi:hypothetical protein
MEWQDVLFEVVGDERSDFLDTIIGRQKGPQQRGNRLLTCSADTPSSNGVRVGRDSKGSDVATFQI